MARTTAPANAFAISRILKHINDHPSTLTTRDAQDAFLCKITKRHRFQYYSSTYGHTHHDGKSLRAVLVQVVRKHGVEGLDIRPGKIPLDEFFERGEEVLEQKYVEAVHEAAKEMEDSEDEDADGESVDEEDEWAREVLPLVIQHEEEGSEDEWQPSERLRKRRSPPVREISTTPTTPSSKSQAAKSPATPQRRSFSDLDTSDMSTFRDATSANRAKWRREAKKARPLKRRISSSSESDVAERDVPAGPKAVRRASRPRKMAKNVKDESGKAVRSASPSIFPPHVDGQALTKDVVHTDKAKAIRAAPRRFSRASCNIQQEAKQLKEMISSTVSQLLAFTEGQRSQSGEGGTEIVRCGQAVQTSASESMEADAQVGSPSDALQSVVAAFLSKEVFSKALDWESPLALACGGHPFQKYVMPLLRKEQQQAVNSHSLLASAAAAQLRDEGFLAEVVKPKARELAGDLRVSLRARVVAMFDAKVTEAGCEAMEGKLEKMCDAALRLRGLVSIEAESVEVQWSL